MNLIRSIFSHNNISPQGSRFNLEKTYEHLLQKTNEFNRKLVSYQGNKGELVHGWIRYKEGFSYQLVKSLFDKFDIKPGGTVLEPFSGSATTLLVAKSLGIDAVGIEILPLCHLSWEAKSHIFDYDLKELNDLFKEIRDNPPLRTEHSFSHINITASAFPSETEADLMFYTDWFQRLDISPESKTLTKLLLTSILEEISYTRKDGQYLRWDYRSEKVKFRNRSRAERGLSPTKKLDKGELPSVKDSLLRAFSTVLEDIQKLQQVSFPESEQRLLKGSVLEILPKEASDQFSGVVTSPPYCNRYDYTRTYALELAYLNSGGEEGIKDLRQTQLSCTVENKSKLNRIRDFYKSIGEEKRFDSIYRVIKNNRVLKEVNDSLKIRLDRGEINNRGILSMVDGYFTELTFVFAEILRTCKSGAHVAFINDNVRYGGEVIPVDLLSTNLADQLGFDPVTVYVLPQRKGNSSQQMGKFGREALRKSITIWRKP